MNSKINRRQVTALAVAAGVVSTSEAARASALSIFVRGEVTKNPKGAPTCQSPKYSTLPFRQTILIAP